MLYMAQFQECIFLVEFCCCNFAVTEDPMVTSLQVLMGDSPRLQGAVIALHGPDGLGGLP